MDLNDKLSLEHTSAPTLDGVEKILLAELVDSGRVPSRIAVVDAPSALIFDELAGLFPGATLVAYNDSLVDSRLIDGEALASTWNDRFQRVTIESGVRFPESLFESTDVVLARLPKALDSLTEFAASAASFLPQESLVLCAERTKFMTPNQNAALSKHFGEVTASLGRFKSRALRATDPEGSAQTKEFPKEARLGEFGLTLVAHGGVFAGAKLDIGSRLLVENLAELLAGSPTAEDFVDSGCGNGVLSACIAQLRDSARVVGVDSSAAAVLSTLATAHANGFGDRITAIQDDALSGLPDNSAAIVVCNPPFHSGTALDTDVSRRMFRNAGRVLRPGGELWTVYNTPLPHKATLIKVIGKTKVVATNNKFTVTVSTKR